MMDSRRAQPTDHARGCRARLELPHLHDATSDFVSWISTVAKSAEPPVRRSGVAPLVLYGQIGAADLGPLRSCARPGLLDHDVAALELLRERGRGADGERERKGEKLKNASLSVLSRCSASWARFAPAFGARWSGCTA